LEEAVEIVKREYFPKWNKTKNWKIIEDLEIGYNGYCDRVNKIIGINTVLSHILTVS
jgi:hypothetical protein